MQTDERQRATAVAGDQRETVPFSAAARDEGTDSPRSEPTVRRERRR